MPIHLSHPYPHTAMYLYAHTHAYTYADTPICLLGIPMGLHACMYTYVYM